MQVPTFLIGRYFARWEQNMPDSLSTADVEAYHQKELLALADEESRSLWHNLCLEYTTTQGHPLLRAEIASLYDGEIQSDNILTFAGGEEAIYIFFTTLLQPGDHAIVLWPAYQSLYEVARAVGAEVTLVPLSEMDGWSVDIEKIRAAIRPTTRVIVVNFPHAPTGALPARDTFLAINCLAQEAGIYVFSDESFRFLEYDPSDRLPAATECYEKGISLGSMSKSFALAGLRVGWLVVRDHDLLRRMLSFKDYTSVGNSASSELLALIGLRAREVVLARSLNIITQNLVVLDNFFANWSHVFAWIRPRAGSIAFPHLQYKMPIEQFAEELIEEENVLLLPGTVYEYPGNYFRIGFARRNMPTVLARLENFTARRLHTQRCTH